ncbi:RecBCD enzyme subunit RecC [compost metagenome]
MPQARSLNPGFMVVHGNRLDELRSLVVSWMRRYPLAPLENEIALVQSNGIAQWLKLALAEDPEADDQGGCGIAAAIDVQLPGSFMWQLYRMVLGREEIPETSLLDKAPLTWRLMRLLPEVIDQPHFEPLQRFLIDDADLRKRYQLAERNTRSTAPTGSKTGPTACIKCETPEARISPCPRPTAGRPNYGAPCCWTSVHKAWPRAAPVSTSVSSSASGPSNRHPQGCRRG